MQAKARIAGHPIHPILIAFPLGLLATSLIFDLIYLGNKNGRLADASFWMISAGIIGGLMAAVFGLIDWIAIPAGTRAKAIGLWHGVGNVLVVVLFIVSWSMRYNGPTTAPGGWAIVLSVLGLLLAVVTGWMGGELVDRMGVGVDEGAHLNSPNSLSGRPAAEVDENYTAHGAAATTTTNGPIPGRTAGAWDARTTEEQRRDTGHPTERASDRLSPPV
jgi:uncharacterized membrane protein